MINNYIEPHEDYEEPVPPNAVQEFTHAKSFLQKSSTVSGDNLYDHLTDVLNKILAERPENVIDFFEEYSRKVKERRYNPLNDHIEDIYVPPRRYSQANLLMPILKPLTPGEPSTVAPEDLELADMLKNNMSQLLYYFEQTGVGLPKAEMFYLTLSMRKLIHTQPISSIRFWGVIHGVFKNYYVVETELKAEEYIIKNEQLIEDERVWMASRATAQDDPNWETDPVVKALNILAQQLAGEDYFRYPRVLPPMPVNLYKPPAEPPFEPYGVGVNRKVYFVCNELGEDWIELPYCIPKQIRVARQICKSFSGYLDREVLTYPEFPGNERHYLRAQIARISAGTDVSPLGYFTFAVGGGGEDEEEEEGEGGGPKTTYSVNPKYDPPPLKDMVDGSMSFWVHHTAYILPQGRTSWWNPDPLPPQGEDIGEGEEDAGEKRIGPEPETGPPLLTPCSEDAALEAVPAWSVRSSSGIAEEFAVGVVRSNLWPGAYTFATQDKLFRNVYLGFGLKYKEHNFSPLPLPPVQQEYPIGPEIMEVTDPTGAQEEEWRIAHLPKPPPEPKAGGEFGEEPEEEEDEDEEDE